jgi:hypothetical protein
MNALFYITVLRKAGEKWLAFVVTTPDGPHDRHAAVLDTFNAEFRREFQALGFPVRVHAEFVCLTPESVWKEV